MKRIEINEADLPPGKFNGAQLVSAIAAQLGVSESMIGYSCDFDSDYKATSLTLDVPLDADAGAILSAVKDHAPAKSEIEVEQEKPTLEARIAALEAKVLALEGK